MVETPQFIKDVVAIMTQNEEFTYYFPGDKPAEPVEQIRDRWFIKMGFAGFNSPANNATGYATKEKAISMIRFYQNRGKK